MRTTPRQGMRVDVRWWASVAAIGAAALTIAYFADPKQGHARRSHLRDRSIHGVRQARRATVRLTRRLIRRGYGSVERRLHRTPEPAEGLKLLDRVESELFEDPTVPRGRMNFNVEGRTIVARGQLDSWAEIEEVEAKIRRIPGVAEVRSLLHVPGTPAPNKVAALRVTVGPVEAVEDWPPEPPPDVDSES